METFLFDPAAALKTQSGRHAFKNVAPPLFGRLRRAAQRAFLHTLKPVSAACYVATQTAKHFGDLMFGMAASRKRPLKRWICGRCAKEEGGYGVLRDDDNAAAPICYLQGDVFQGTAPKIEAFLLPKALRIKHFQRAIENEAAVRFKAPFGKWTKIVPNLF